MLWLFFDCYGRNNAVTGQQKVTACDGTGVTARVLGEGRIPRPCTNHLTMAYPSPAAAATVPPLLTKYEII